MVLHDNQECLIRSLLFRNTDIGMYDWKRDCITGYFFSVDLHHAALQFSPGALTSKQKSFLYVRRYSFKMSVMGCWRKYGFHMFKGLCFFSSKVYLFCFGFHNYPTSSHWWLMFSWELTNTPRFLIWKCANIVNVISHCSSFFLCIGI